MLHSKPLSNVLLQKPVPQRISLNSLEVRCRSAMAGFFWINPPVLPSLL